MNIIRKIKDISRYLFTRMWNRQFLVFLFFLALSTSFWFFQALNETYEEDFSLPVELRNVPRNVVITTGLPETVQVVLRDKGTTLLNYKFGDKLPAIVLDYNVYANSSGHVRILSSEIQRQLRQKLASATVIVSVRPDTLEFYYNNGSYKRVPVRMRGQIQPAPGYTISSQRLSPDSVLVYAADQQLDTIDAAYVSPLYLSDVSAPVTKQLSLATVRGVKFVPAEVSFQLGVDRLVEKRFTVPIIGKNFPEGEKLRTFPSQVEVIFQVSMTLYRRIHPSDFTVVVDYNELKADGGNRCRLYVEEIPAGVSHIRLSEEEAEYVIETLSTTAN